MVSGHVQLSVCLSVCWSSVVVTMDCVWTTATISYLFCLSLTHVNIVSNGESSTSCSSALMSQVPAVQRSDRHLSTLAQLQFCVGQGIV